MRARVAAPLVAALLGITGGTVTALVTADGRDPDLPAATEDPLGLGIGKVRLACSPNQGVLVLGFGNTAPVLLAAIGDNTEGEPTYIDTAESCNTIYGPEDRDEPPRYAVILGPYDNLRDACATRMDPARRGDFVTRLRAGNTETVKCVCVLVRGPELRIGMVATDATAVWVRSLQGMFHDVYPDDFPRSRVTGTYDRETEAIVKNYQQASGRDADGVVDDATWTLLANRICASYDF